MKKIFSETYRTIKYCGKGLFKQEIIFKLLTMSIGYPLVMYIINLTLKIAKVPYLTNEMSKNYIRHPFTIAALLVVLFIVAIYTLWEISLISVFCDYDIKNKKITNYSILNITFLRFKSLFKLKRMPVLVYGAMVLPIVAVTLLSVWLFEFPAMLYMFKITKKARMIATVIYVVLFIYAFFNLFTINIILREGKNYFAALKKSARLVFRNSLKTFFNIVFWNVLITAIIGLVYFLFTVLVVLGVKLFGKSDMGIAIYLTAIRGLTNGLSYFLLAIYIPVTYIMIQSMYASYDDEKYERIIFSENLKPRFVKIYYITTIVVASITLVVDGYFLKNAIFGNPFSRLNINTVPVVIAHRGSSAHAPENTLPAFENAIDDMADYIELDVKQTKDDIVIVLHDANLKRTTGVKKDIWKVDYDELLTYDAGSWFDEEFIGTNIPTLEEVIIACKDKVKFDIEIKPTGHDNNLEQAVIDLITEYEIENDVIITSMKYEVLKRIKEINPKIRTGYIMSAAYGKFYNMTCADYFCINYSFVTKNIVDLIHNNGKKIYVWTVNGKKSMEDMTKMGVDGIITDNPVRCREYAYKKYSNEKLLDILKYVLE